MSSRRGKQSYQTDPDTFIFDEQRRSSIEKEDHPGFWQRLYGFVSSRYALLATVFLLIGGLIFIETASLQFNPTTAAGISESVGVPRQQTVKASRGDILDVSGIPLAWSQPSSKLFLTYAGLDSDDLNARLLDLAIFLEENGVSWQSELTRYFDLTYTEADLAAMANDPVGQPAWQMEMAEIIYWQMDNNLFRLREVDISGPIIFDDRYVKEDPNVFYDHLLFERFNIEDPQSGIHTYTQAEAFRIMQLRYLIFQNNWAFINGTPIELARDVPQGVIHAINEQNYRFMGVISSRESERVYSDLASELSHVIGYVGRISANQYNDLRSLGYAPDAIVGQTGVESAAERYLAGQDGVKPYNIWSVAEDAGMFFSEQIGKDPIPGNHVRLTIDLKLQQVAQDSLERVIDDIRNNADADDYRDADAGSVVMLDVNTGAVLAMASSPGFDPNDFLTQSWDEEAADRVSEYLTDNLNKPMLNRSMMEIYAPGSTFKAVTAVAGLESGTITPSSSTIRCEGQQEIGGIVWRCLERPVSGHGNLNLTQGMATSCNLYFFNLGVGTTINIIDYWGKALGLGELTGIELPGEVRGFRANRENMALLENNPEDRVWFPADTCQASIGQSYNSFTVLQLAVYTAGLATGNRVTPHVIAEVTRPDGTIVFRNEPELSPIGMQESTLNALREAMVAVTATDDGTASRAFSDFPLMVAAKTGTAETGFEDISSSNGLFISYAPADNPQVAIAQIIEKGRWGSNTIGIARDLLEAYFDLNGQELDDLIIQQTWIDLAAAEVPDADAEDF